MVKLILINLCCGSILFSYAQGRQNSLSLDFGIGSLQVQENALNSLVHKGSLIITGLSFASESQTGLSHKIEVSFSIGSLKSRFEENRNSTYWNPQLRYSLTKPITNSISVGGYLSGVYQVMEFENWDDSHLYWVTSYQMGPVVKIDNIPFKGLFSNVSFPLLAIVSRSRNEITNKVDSGKFSDIFNLIHSHTAILSFIKYLVLDVHLGYPLINSKRINLEVRSNPKYVHSVISNTKEFTSFDITLGFLFTYKFN